MAFVGTRYTPYTLTVDGGAPLEVLEVELRAPDVEYVRSLHAVLPDASWRYVDGNGHEHRWARTGRGALRRPESLPSLTARIEHVRCDGSCGAPVSTPPLPEPERDSDLLTRLDWLIAGPGSEGDVGDDAADHCEGYDITVWYCAICDDRVDPGTVPDVTAQTTGVPVAIGPPTALVVVDRDPRGDDRQPALLDAVLRAPDGTEYRGQARVGNWQRRNDPAGVVETRVEVELAILDERPPAG